MKTRLIHKTHILVFLAFCVLFSACKKMETNNNLISVKERFFSIPSNANPALKKVIENLKEIESKHPFVEDFVKYEGYPIWKNTKISITNHLANKDEGIDTMLLVPVILDNALYVKDILAVKMNFDVLFKIYKYDEYALYGFNDDPNRTEPNANDIVSRILQFEIEIFGSSYYLAKDPRLFNDWPDSTQTPNSFVFVPVPNYDYGGDGECMSWGVYYNGEIQYTYTTGMCETGTSGGYSGAGELDGGVGWVPIPPVGGGGQLPPTPLPPCNFTGWEKLTAVNSILSGPCTPPLPIPPPPSNTDIIVNPENPGLDFPFVFDLSSPLINLSQYFNCFSQIPDAGATFSVTIYCDVPVNAHPNSLIDQSGHPGHTFISMTKSNGTQSITQTFGFYPTNGPLSTTNAPVPSQIRNNGGHEANAYLSMTNISQANFQTLINTALQATYHFYDLNDYNCTNYALEVFNSIRPNPLVVPDDEVFLPVIIGYPAVQCNYHQTPNSLYRVLAQTPGAVSGVVVSGPASHGPCD